MDSGSVVGRARCAGVEVMRSSRERLEPDVTAVQLGCCSIAPLVPQLLQRAARRSRSLEAFGPHLMIHVALGVG